MTEIRIATRSFHALRGYRLEGDSRAAGVGLGAPPFMIREAAGAQRMGTASQEDLDLVACTLGLRPGVWGLEAGSFATGCYPLGLARRRSMSFCSTVSGTRPCTHPPDMTTSLMIRELM